MLYALLLAAALSQTPGENDSFNGPIFSQGATAAAGEPPGTLLFSFMNPAAPEVTATCTCPATITAATGQTVTAARTTVSTCSNADGGMTLCGTGTFVVELVQGAYRIAFGVSKTANNLYSNDLTQAAWVKSGISVALNATGPLGTANSASTLTATGSDGTVLQSITLTSNTRTLCARVRRKTGTGAIYITRDNGVNWLPIDSLLSSTFYEKMRPTLPGLSGLTTTSTNPTIGFKIATSGDAIEVAYVNEMALDYCGPDILTGATATNRAQDSGSYPNPLTPGDPTKFCVAATGLPFEMATGNVWSHNTNKGLLTLGTWGTSTPNTMTIRFSSSAKMNVNVEAADGGDRVISATPAIDAGSHDFINVTRPGALYNFVDGQPIASATSGTGAGTITTQGATNFVGASSASNTGFIGWVSNVRVGDGPRACHQ